MSATSPTPLVVATTFDPATPYRGELNLVRDLKNARLLTMVGDGHTAYGGNSACIDSAVEAYVEMGRFRYWHPMPAGCGLRGGGVASSPFVPPARDLPITAHGRPMLPLG